MSLATHWAVKIAHFYKTMLVSSMIERRSFKLVYQLIFAIETDDQ